MLTLNVRSRYCTDVEARAAVVRKDAKTIYQIPRGFYEQNVDDLIWNVLVFTDLSELT